MTSDPTDRDRRAEPIERRNSWSEQAPRMGDVTHVHTDHDPRAWHWFARGPSVAADGGRGARSDRDIEDERIRDVAHEPPAGEGATGVWDRGERHEDGV